MFGKNRRQEGMQTPEEAGGHGRYEPQRDPEQGSSWGRREQERAGAPEDFHKDTRHPSNEDRDQGMRRP